MVFRQYICFLLYTPMLDAGAGIRYDRQPQIQSGVSSKADTQNIKMFTSVMTQIGHKQTLKTLLYFYQPVHQWTIGGCF